MRYKSLDWAEMEKVTAEWRREFALFPRRISSTEKVWLEYVEVKSQYTQGNISYDFHTRAVGDTGEGYIITQDCGGW
jgi:hypothetical protein